MLLWLECNQIFTTMFHYLNNSIQLVVSLSRTLKGKIAKQYPEAFSSEFRLDHLTRDFPKSFFAFVFLLKIVKAGRGVIGRV